MDTNKIRYILNMLFLILAVASIVTYFLTTKDDRTLFIYVCGAALFVKIMEFFIRFTNR